MSGEASPSSSLCRPWFLKNWKYILASLVAGLVLALVLTLGLTLTTTASKGFLIVGGDKGAYRKKVEIYIPSLEKTCELDDLPDSYRHGATIGREEY